MPLNAKQIGFANKIDYVIGVEVDEETESEKLILSPIYHRQQAFNQRHHHRLNGLSVYFRAMVGQSTYGNYIANSHRRR